MKKVSISMDYIISATFINVFKNYGIQVISNEQINNFIILLSMYLLGLGFKLEVVESDIDNYFEKKIIANHGAEMFFLKDGVTIIDLIKYLYFTLYRGYVDILLDERLKITMFNSYDDIINTDIENTRYKH